MKQYPNHIISEIEALRTKDSERDFFKAFKNKLPGKAIMKVSPFKGFYADMYYEEEGKSLLVKFMDTSEDTFSILEEELLEIMEEEHRYYEKSLKKWGKEFELNFIYFMPYVDLSRFKNTFIQKFIIDRSKFEELKKNSLSLSNYMTSVDEIFQNMTRYQIAKEYHVIKKESSDRVINKDFKKIVFMLKDNPYQAIPLTETQIKQISSMKYGNTMYIGPAGSGKTTTMLSRAMKLARIYNKDSFLFITFNRQLMTDLNKYLEMIDDRPENLEIINFHSFILNISKKYSLKIESGSKKTFDEQFKSIFKKISKIYADYNIYKGIFIDEAENFKEEYFEFLQSLLYRNKKFMMISSDKGKDILGTMDDFIGGWENLHFEDVWEFSKNYRSTKNIAEFTNRFLINVMDYCGSKGLIIPQDYYIPSQSQRIMGKKIKVLHADSVENKLQAIVNTIQDLHNKKGISYSDICVIYPFNKRRTKSNNTIYFQYMLREALKKAEIPFIIAHEDITSLTYKTGVTISNIFSATNLEFHTVILCQLEMLYTHSLPDHYSATEANSFIKSMNMVYTAATRATDMLYLITLLEEDSVLSNLLQGTKEGIDFLKKV